MPTTNSPKGSAIPVRPTPQMRQQLDELIAAGWGNASDIIRIAVHDMHKREIKHMNSGLTDNEARLKYPELGATAQHSVTLPESCWQDIEALGVNPKGKNVRSEGVFRLWQAWKEATVSR